MNHGLFLNFNFPKRNRGGPPHAAQGDPPVRPGGAPPSPPLKRNIYLILKLKILISNIDNIDLFYYKKTGEYKIELYITRFKIDGETNERKNIFKYEKNNFQKIKIKILLLIEKKIFLKLNIDKKIFIY